MASGISKMPPKCARRLILCLDGTQNDAINTELPLTNVARIARCIDRQGLIPSGGRDSTGIEQIVYYRRGIGTGTSEIFTKWWDTYSGRGIDNDVREAYFFICQNYRYGMDEIVLIGFSRGAFTARVLAAFIGRVGVLKQAGLDFVYNVFTAWKGDEKTATTMENLEYALSRLESTQRILDVDIKACAVFDTVAALSGDEFDFVKPELPNCVRIAIQALALNEEREQFKPLLWKLDPGASREQKLKQCWFLGAHSDVGGGSPNLSLANITLLWMIYQLEDVVRFDARVIEEIGIPQAFDKDQLEGRVKYTVYENTVRTHLDTKITMNMSIPVRDFQRRTDAHVDEFAIVQRGSGWAYRNPCSGGNLAREELHWSVDHLLRTSLASKCPPLPSLYNTESDAECRSYEESHLKTWLCRDCERMIWESLTSQDEAGLIPATEVIPTYAVLVSPGSWSVQTAQVNDAHVSFQFHSELNNDPLFTHKVKISTKEEDKKKDWEKDYTDGLLKIPLSLSLPGWIDSTTSRTKLVATNILSPTKWLQSPPTPLLIGQIRMEGLGQGYRNVISDGGTVRHAETKGYCI